MPEIAEVARVVHFIRKHLAGHKLQKVTAFEDVNVFGKVGCTAEQVEKELTGKTIVDAKQQGKYFWLEMSSPPHLLMHFGMAGWFHIKDVHTGYREAGRDQPMEKEWPPKHTKFILKTDNGEEGAFVDFRRFGRVRLIDCAADKMRKTTPLKENGPDPVVDKEKVSIGFLAELCARKKAPIKAILLDQGNISGIGNWVSDEIFYDAKMHPEQNGNTLSKAQIKQLHKSIHYVCGLACDVLADSSKFPEEWLFKHRWGKGKKDAPKTLPNGAKIQFLTVGGRTSAIIPSVQKTAGAVAEDVDRKKSQSEAEVDEKSVKKESKKKRKNESDEEAEDEKRKPAKASRPTKKEPHTDDSKQDIKAAKPKPKPKKSPVKKEGTEESSGRRRSTRQSGA